MQVINNTIKFTGFVVICAQDVHAAIDGYVQDMADQLATVADQTPRGIARALRNMNNDGTWSLKVGA